MVLSKEEKKSKKEAQKRALLAEEEFKKQLKKDELSREIKAHCESRKVIDKKWLETMAGIKDPMYRKEIEVMRQSFNRSYDKKYHLINQITHLKQTAGDQYQRTVCSGCDKIDSIIKHFMVDLVDMNKQYESKTLTLLKRGQYESNAILKDSKDAESLLKLLFHNASKIADDISWTRRGEYLVKKDDEYNIHSKSQEEIGSFLENNYNTIWDHYIRALKKYVSGITDNQKNVRRLRRKQNKMEDIIVAQAKKINDEEDIIKHLRAELEIHDSGAKHVSFRSRRARYRDACYRLKTCLHQSADIDVKQITRLVKASGESIDWIAAAYKKAEKILRLADICRKFETLREKTLPYNKALLECSFKVKPTRQRRLESSIVDKALATTSALSRLWLRISKAELSKKALYNEKILLEEENAEMMQELEQRDPEKVIFNCPYILKQATKSTALSLSFPIAIDGRLEAKKNVHFK